MAKKLAPKWADAARDVLFGDGAAPGTTVGMFDDDDGDGGDDDDMFGSGKSVAKPAAAAKAGLFGDSSDEEGDLFG